MTTPNIELLAPAGSPEALDAAVGEGADGVYLGLKSFNARLRSANFTYSQFEGALRSLHRMGRRLYVTVNTVFEEREADRMYQLLKYLAGLGPDGIIIQDFGAARMVREHFPGLKLHASTQMNIASARAVNLLSKAGFSRVVLARELSLEEIRALRDRTNMELEVFVHGALCVSASGLCLFSSFLGGKSANRGLCTQACRRFYRHGEEGGYYFSPADLQLIERIPELADAGVNSVKIEGRMKSAGYVGAVVAAYRRAIDSLAKDRPEDRERGVREAMELLRRDFARKKTFFYLDEDKRIDWLNPEQDGGTGISLGTLLKVRGEGADRQGLILPVEGGSPLPEAGDTVRLHKADDSRRISFKLTPLKAPARPPASAPGEGLWISIPDGFERGDSVYLIQTKAGGKRYAPVIPRNLDAFRRVPGRDKAPAVSLPLVKRKDIPFPEGIYVGVSRIEDLYAVQSIRPAGVMLAYNRKTAAGLLERGKPLPFKPGEIILVLDPFFPQAREEPLEEELGRLRQEGYHQFVLNNLGHFSYFRNDSGVLLIAGPYLYTFNRRALSFVSGLGVSAVISPLENNRQNLERTADKGRRAAAFITLFAYPALFRIRADLKDPAPDDAGFLGDVYDFEDFEDSQGEGFRLLSAGGQGSQVIPRRPFSIVDKAPFLREAGFSRFILDFSGPPLRKKEYKEVIAALHSASPVPAASRFNWKNGFYHDNEELVIRN